ncbi:ROK family protein [Pedobacter hiemivivus]|uniref:ROK family protein n=1 Tax=Pedobacter hiemivivus TaxID=2530454 RepID=A0A4U1G124_9SPHI|nr:ROK family protein [Pedobacter hiemivivus]TCC96505.1 ROK family protein [Pedobacter hiemivivus]TKC57187.1 ROK family protein [Pedobacter hiemivivus]
MKNPIVLGVDIGGSHITAALVDLAAGTLIKDSFQRKQVNSGDSAGAIFDNWCNVIQGSFGVGNISEKRIGIAIPGPFEYDDGISFIKDQDKFKSLYNVNVKHELAARLNIKTDNIRFINDAAGFLKGEAFGGAAQGYDKAIGLTLGTGLGSAFFEDGVTEDAALWKSTFKDGIAEDYLATGWFVKRYFELTGRTIRGVKELNRSECFEQPERQIFEEFGNNLGLFIKGLLVERPGNLLVLGGNIVNAHECFMPYLELYLKKENCCPEIKIAELKEDAALIGAGSCWSLT